MKIGISLEGVNNSLANLRSAGVIVQSDFNGQLIENGKRLRDKAKEILEGKVNPIYSTGKLRDSIELNVTQQTGAWSGIESTNISVGPDMRKAPYAEWVEIGHYMTGGWNIKGNKVKGARWWKGHHYMEGAWLEISPNISKQITDTLKVKLNNFGKSAKRTRHLTTGRFVAGWGGAN